MVKPACCLLILLCASVPVSFADDEAKWGELSGTIVLDGELPQVRELPVTKDSALLKLKSVPDESLVVNPKNHGVANVVVFLAGRGAVAVHPAYDQQKTAKVELKFEQGRFKPHVLLLRTTQTMVHTNKDGVFYNPTMSVLKNQPH